MTDVELPRYSPEWLEQRERADGDARATALLQQLPAALRKPAAGGPPLVIRDLGCGTGSMGRWLAARLPGPQHWVLYDRDPELLEHAAARMAGSAADGAPVTVETRQADITALTGADLAGADLITASALLDLFTAEEVDILVAGMVTARCPALLTLSVTGRVQLTPVDPLDGELMAAFNAHQRRTSGGRRLLGPDAVRATTEAFTHRGVTVASQPSPWRLGPKESVLAAEWLRGWVDIACEQRPDLRPAADAYLGRRLAQAGAGELRVILQHSDLLATPMNR